tara:strand:- start:204 stop:407 length:204 start_codon:yes stop_codon:yes gene_type:complete
MISLEIEEKNRPIHIWTGTNNYILVSFEDTKTLKSYSNINHAVNSLYSYGFKKTAKALAEKHNGGNK